jgi:signal transduction histidine kinase
LAFEFIQRSNGSIGVQNNPVKGSTFWFQLPLEMPPLNKV